MISDMIVYWIIFLVYAELYSVGLCLFLKRERVRRWALCLIPFAAFFYIDKLTDGFHLLVFPVRHWGKTVLMFGAVALAAQIYGSVLDDRIDPMYALWDLIKLPSALNFIVFWLGTASSAVRILLRCKMSFRGEWLVCLCLVTVPVLFAVLKNKSEEPLYIDRKFAAIQK